MSKKIELFNDAIADAKALKETALSNAKLALAETFAPKVSSMFSNRLNEMEEELDENLEEEKTLDEILNSLEEGDEMPIEDELPMETGEEGDEFPDAPEEMEGDLDQQEVAEITVEELKDVIRSVMQELEGGEEEGMEFEPEMGDEGAPEVEDEEEINLDEILDEMGNTSGTEFSAAAGGLDALIAKIKELAAKTPEAIQQVGDFLQDLGAGAGSALRSEELQEVETKLEEKTQQLQEVNLLNSKLISVNKIFRTKNLTESQKVKVINAFDRATSLKEVKNTFETIKEAFTGSTNSVKPLRENVGRASKPAGSAQEKPQILTEDTAFISRMQKLAGII